MKSGSNFWISPGGTFYRVPESEHEEWAAENICPDVHDELTAKFPHWSIEDSGDAEGYRGEIFQSAWDAGWTDAHFDGGSRVLFLRNPNASKLPSRSALEQKAVVNGWALATDWWKAGAALKPFFDARPADS